MKCKTVGKRTRESYNNFIQLDGYLWIFFPVGQLLCLVRLVCIRFLSRSLSFACVFFFGYNCIFYMRICICLSMYTCVCVLLLFCFFFIYIFFLFCNSARLLLLMSLQCCRFFFFFSTVAYDFFFRLKCIQLLLSFQTDASREPTILSMCEGETVLRFSLFLLGSYYFVFVLHI